MRTLSAMLLRFFIPAFIITLLFFVLVFQLMDIFTNLWRYINQDAGLIDIGRIALFYLPKCISFSLPIALLFSISFVLGSMYVNNEMISVFGCGVNLSSFVLPLIVSGLLLSLGAFFFEERVVIQTLKMKNQLTQEVLDQTVTYSNSNVTVTSNDGRFVYQVSYYNDRKEVLTGLVLVERDDTGAFAARVDAESGEWNGRNWVLFRCRVYEWEDDHLAQRSEDRIDMPALTEQPSIFRRISRKIDEMPVEEAKEYISSLKRAGLGYQESLSQYHRKFAFSFTPLIVVLIASSIGGIFRRNILLMSLLSALGVAVAYYVVQMVAMTLARNGYISPIAGAWVSLALFVLVGAGLFRMAHT